MAQTHSINGEQPVIESVKHGIGEYHGCGGIQDVYTFNNGYSLSVIPEYGVQQNAKGESVMKPIKGRYECAVFYNGELTYDTHITADVIHNQNDPQVHNLLMEVQRL
tara:strand:+ start:145 stop:465 length:321 start_codon:yes stop_codon:yes gene_type:complete